LYIIFLHILIVDKKITKADQLPMAGKTVDGIFVGEGPVPNLSSISSSLDHYEVLDGIRELSMDYFSPSLPYSTSERKRVDMLVKEIIESNSIVPLIVVEDSEGFYILEGGHRFDALCLMNADPSPQWL
jgi:hypothetical protein